MAVRRWSRSAIGWALEDSNPTGMCVGAKEAVATSGDAGSEVDLALRATRPRQRGGPARPGGGPASLALQSLTTW